MSLGAPTRMYVLREKLQTQGCAAAGEDGLVLPEGETELNNLTEFNTTHNKHFFTHVEEGNITFQRPRRIRRCSRVSFSDEEEIINAEDVDPSIGYFRNMIHTAAVPIKEKTAKGSLNLEAAACCKHSPPVSEGHEAAAVPGGVPTMVPKLAPEVDVMPPSVEPQVTLNGVPASAPHTSHPLNEPCKKQYVKEVWPGKKPTPSLLI